MSEIAFYKYFLFNTRRKKGNKTPETQKYTKESFYADRMDSLLGQALFLYQISTCISYLLKRHLFLR